VPIVEAVLSNIYAQEAGFNEAGAEDVRAEISGMAEGACAEVNAVPGSPRCDPDRLALELQRLNVFPELLKMQCSMLGAWGAATPDGHLRQMRTLDFGEGPWANASVVSVYHPSHGNAFASVSFPGFVGAVTGFSRRITLSQKVWDVTGESGNQPGSYDGEADALVIRRLLQFANSTAEAVHMAQTAHRTWAVFLGLGDASDAFRVVAYRQPDAVAYDDQSLPAVTKQPALQGVAYVDRHPQPSADTTMSTLLAQMHGQMTGLAIAERVPRAIQSGDVHLAVYDFHLQKSWVATGVTNDVGAYEPGGMAFERPLVEFSWNDLFDEPPPAAPAPPPPAHPLKVAPARSSAQRSAALNGYLPF
jgi:hypothetical protein